MKLQCIILVLLFHLSTSFFSTKPLRGLVYVGDCQTIIDSANIFIQTSEFAVNTKPTMTDPERNLRLDNWLTSLSFRSLTCLLESDNISLKTLGFIYGANFHSDSLYKNYSHLLTDTTTIQLFMADGTRSPKVELGKFLSAMSQKLKVDNDNFAKRPEIENIVSGFIKQYAMHPNSYKPISFPYFSMGSDNDGGPRHFGIRHEYELKNNEGKTEKVISAFVLDKGLKVNVIEKDSSTYISASPPKLDYWLKRFGRKLTNGDSLTLGLR